MRLGNFILSLVACSTVLGLGSAGAQEWVPGNSGSLAGSYAKQAGDGLAAGLAGDPAIALVDGKATPIPCPDQVTITVANQREVRTSSGNTTFDAAYTFLGVDGELKGCTPLQGYRGHVGCYREYFVEGAVVAELGILNTESPLIPFRAVERRMVRSVEKGLEFWFWSRNPALGAGVGKCAYARQ